MSSTIALTSLVLLVSHVVIFGPRLLRINQEYNDRLQLGSADIEKNDIGFIELNGQTYFVAKALVSNVTYYEAECACLMLNMNLISFETEQEYKLIEDFYLQNPELDAWFWTSGRRLTGGKWTWTGSEVDVTETSWGPEQPDLDPTSPACIKFKAAFGGWDDDSCDTVIDSYLCEN